MTAVFLVLALIGLIILAVGAVLYLVVKPVNPTSVLLMVIGALAYAIAQIVLVFDALF